MEFEITRLNLLSALRYLEEESDPFGYLEGSGEKLYCFEIDDDQYQKFEPDETALLLKPVFCGKAAPAGRDGINGKTSELPAGDYLFAQKREILGREEIARMAAAIQSEGLWQRLKPGKFFYLRYLHEDGCGVTQIFRPYTE